MSSLLRDQPGFSDPWNGNRLSRADLHDWVNGVLEEGFSKGSKRRTPFLLVREKELEFEIPYEAIDSTIEDVHFFGGSEGIFLGIGRAKEWEFYSETSLRTMKTALKLSNLSSCPSKTWLLGGWSFPPTRLVQRVKDVIWKDFPYSRWVVPALLFTTANGRNHVILAAYFDSSTEGRLKEYYARLASTITSLRIEPKSPPIPLRLNNLPSRKRWVSLARYALESISKGKLRKVVLSRSVRILFDDAITCSTVLKKLIESNPGSTVFAMKKGGTTFLGATPEHLLLLKNREIGVDCLAASAPRSSDSETDDSLGLNLITERKSRYEHRLVVQGVKRSLSAICSEIKAPEKPLLKRLPNIQHLHTVVKGHLLPAVDIWSAALSLWPTPATGGEPKEPAVRWIQDFEPVNRGWYSGVVGCVNANGDGNLVVSIRSGVIRGQRAVLFAGSGIVSGSDPNREFEETDWKMATMMEALAVREPE